MLTPGADLCAAGHWVPRRIRPLNRRLITHFNGPPHRPSEESREKIPTANSHKYTIQRHYSVISLGKDAAHLDAFALGTVDS
jgi:hypothetical protein